MRIAIVALVVMGALAMAGEAFCQGRNRVDGYTRRDGTYVQPHYRTNPDGNYRNNWSTEGNYNPYTLREGSRPRDSYVAPQWDGNNGSWGWQRRGN